MDELPGRLGVGSSGSHQTLDNPVDDRRRQERSIVKCVQVEENVEQLVTSADKEECCLGCIDISHQLLMTSVSSQAKLTLSL